MDVGKVLARGRQQQRVNARSLFCQYSHWHILSPSKNWIPFLNKRLHTLNPIFTVPAHTESHHFIIHCLGQVHLIKILKASLCQGYWYRGVFCDLLGQFPCCLRKFIMGHYPINHTNSQRFFSVYYIPGEDQFRCFGVANQPRQKPYTPPIRMEVLSKLFTLYAFKNSKS